MIYLAWVASDLDDADLPGPWEEVVVLDPGLLLIASEASRSQVYHALKHHLPADTALLVAPLHDAPKFSRLAPGATAWVRERFG